MASNNFSNVKIQVACDEDSHLTINDSYNAAIVLAYETVFNAILYLTCEKRLTSFHLLDISNEF